LWKRPNEARRAALLCRPQSVAGEETFQDVIGEEILQNMIGDWIKDLPECYRRRDFQGVEKKTGLDF